MSTSVAEPVVVPAPHERGWARITFATMAFLVIPMTPLLRVLLPTEQTALLVAPALAACAIIGWLAGGRAALAGVWTLVAAWSVYKVAQGGDSALRVRRRFQWRWMRRPHARKLL